MAKLDHTLNGMSFDNICVHCGKKTTMVEHEFYSGLPLPNRPSKTWNYTAPLYHNVEHEVGFCDVVCSGNWHEKMKAK